ncbi:hypothetical protein [Nonomuraea sp. B19D2]|uniref:hypothetical protein n=1 Tax=Nonomuraea sp. B19D2 TaxID=3159561 RepID=UPI0032DAFA17
MCATSIQPCFKQAVMVLRWFLDGTRPKQLTSDGNIRITQIAAAALVLLQLEYGRTVQGNHVPSRAKR